MTKRPGEAREVGLEKARREFEQWRRTRRHGARIPKRLWSLAVEAAHQHGVTRTIQALSLDYYALKQRMLEDPQELSETEVPRSEPTFVELGLPAATKPSCTVELQSERGRALRVELAGLSAEEVVSVVRGLWREEP